MEIPKEPKEKLEITQIQKVDPFLEKFNASKMNFIPAYWNITGIDDQIEAVNSYTNLRYKGNIENFNKLLRGE